MSFYNIRDIYNLKVGDAKAKAVLLCINHFINKDTNIAFPSVPTIAKYTEYSERTVYRCIKLLVDKKFLIKKKTHNHVNQYALTVSHPTPDSQSPEHTINIDNTRSNNNEPTKNNKSKAEIHSITKTRNFFASKHNKKSSFFGDAYSSLKGGRTT